MGPSRWHRTLSKVLLARLIVGILLLKGPGRRPPGHDKVAGGGGKVKCLETGKVFVPRAGQDICLHCQKPLKP